MVMNMYDIYLMFLGVMLIVGGAIVANMLLVAMGAIILFSGRTSDAN